MNKLFYDTYALIELAKHNPAYSDYKDNKGIIITHLNILEFIYFLIREKQESKISDTFEQLERYVNDYDQDILIKAVKMKFKFKGEKLSFVDCIGYCLAMKLGIKFLTGDEKFKSMPNVEFIK